MKIRIIGDIHGEFNAYREIIAGCENSIQLGDLAFNYNFLREVPFSNHMFFSGNHDHHSNCSLWPHWMGKYGELNGDMFFVGGGFSIDREVRIKNQSKWGKTYWEEEELSYNELQQAIDQYVLAKPKIMLSHEAPRSIVDKFTNGDILKRFGFDPDTFTTRTSEALDAMFDKHKPEQWLFGHYHVDWSESIEGCLFTCVNEHGWKDIDVEL